MTDRSARPSPVATYSAVRGSVLLSGKSATARAEQRKRSGLMIAALDCCRGGSQHEHLFGGRGLLHHQTPAGEGVEAFAGGRAMAHHRVHSVLSFSAPTEPRDVVRCRQSRTTRGASSPRRNRFITAILGLILTATLSGCGVLPVAARVLTVVDAISIIDRAVESGTRQHSVPTVPPARVQALVSGTEGDGLWLNSEPGAMRLRVLPEGTLVTLLCSTTGPNITGPGGPTATWQYSQTPEGTTGFLSAAYLNTGGEEAFTPPC